jgi:hypothetical protein
MNIFFGISEDLEDPLKLGRVRVRISGVHTNDANLLPTSDLPWAVPIQGVTSAAMSGIGFSATGILKGTTCIIIFSDDNKQNPLILGTIASIPSTTANISLDSFSQVKSELMLTPPDIPPPNLVQLPDGTQVDPATTNNIPPNSQIVEQGYIGTLTLSQVTTLKATIAKSESQGSGGYSAENSLGYLGKYQIGAMVLEDFGYIKSGSYKAIRNNLQVVSDPNNWTGKDNIVSKEAFKNSPSVQESVMDSMLKRNFTSLCKYGCLTPSSPPEKTAGALMAAHLKGSGPSKSNPGAVDLIRDGLDSSDANGTSCLSYYKKGYACISGTDTAELPTVTNINNQAVDRYSYNGVNRYDVSPNGRGTPKLGFVDPSGKYPLASHMNQPDTPNLASGLSVSDSIVGQKESSRETGIPVANGSSSWDQSPIPYNAVYPYNHVYQSESGHALEFDDTPGAERVNIHHKSGSFIEIDSDGNRVDKITGIRTIIVEADELVYIKGSGHITVDGNISIKAGGGCHIQVGGDCNLSVSGDLNQQVSGSYNLNASGNINLRAGGNILADGTQIHLNDGLASSVNLGGSFNPSITTPKPVDRKEAMAISLEDTATSKLLSGRSSNMKASKTDLTNPLILPTVTGACGFTSLSYDTLLSANFTLKSLCKDGAFPFGGQRGLSAEEIACSAKQLCINVIEPLFAKYSSKGIMINSCIRPVNNGRSQHEIGCAVDIGFSKIRGAADQNSQMFAIAQEIKNLVPFDQLLLEFRDPGHCWIHISFAPTLRRQVLTLLNDVTYSQGLTLLS